MAEAFSRAPSGIAGLDGVLHGGFPRGRTTLVIGGPGTGKTVLAMEYLSNGARRFDEPGIMVSFEESAEAIVENCASFGWDLPALMGTSLHVVDGRMSVSAIRAGDFDIGGLIAVIGDLVVKNGAKRIAFDALDAMFVAAPIDVRVRELQRLLEWLDTTGLTAVITSKPGHESANGISTFEQAEYASDAVIRLSYNLKERLLQRMLRIIKIRGASFAAGEHPVLISPFGFAVAYTDMQKEIRSVSQERLSTGIDRLDRMLSGGFREGSVTLISGLPGTSKTTIGVAFLAAALKRGERVLLVAFDEPAEQMLADMRSVNLDLEPYRATGLLRVASLNAGSAIGDDHLLAIERLVDEHRPKAVLIDPITALQKSGGSEVADLVSDRLANLLKSRGITAVFTAVGDSQLGELESTSARISTVADTWIHLSYRVLGGERNRTITVVKSRGTGHSNQMRELILSDTGITLKDVYYVKGDVLLGTARLEREQQDLVDRTARENELFLQLQGVETQRAMAHARLNEAQREVEALTERATLIAKASALLEESSAENRATARDGRRPDNGHFFKSPGERVGQ